MANSSKVSPYDTGDQALQEYLDLLLKPASAPSELKSYAEASPRPLRMPLPPLAPPVVAKTDTQLAAKPVEAPVTAPEPVVMERVVVAPVLETPLFDTVAAPVPVQLPPVVSAPPVIKTSAEQPVAKAEPETAVVETAEPVLHPLEPAAWADNGRPQWAQQRFEALLFTVGGLNLAVPLVELGAIHALEDREMTPIFGQIEWFLGMLPLKEGSLRVVDTARVVMPERYDDTMPIGYRYVITLSGSDWGLGVDTIHDSVQLEPEAVRWRSSRGKRPWLAGTVVEQMCALLDASQLTWMFHNLDRQRGGARRPRGSGPRGRL